MKKNFSVDLLIEEAKNFCLNESKHKNKDLFGVTDGKAVGTYVEHKFKKILAEKYNLILGSSANGIDLPSNDINTDIKVTSIKQPQSSCPFKNVSQKIFGLGYNLLLFVYEKVDYAKTKYSILNFVSCSFVSKKKTSDYSTTFRLRQMLEDKVNKGDIIGYLVDRNVPADDITLDKLANEILKRKPEQGYLTISNALQWRLQYQRIVDLKNAIPGIIKIVG
jgi:hypothetical protein